MSCEECGGEQSAVYEVTNGSGTQRKRLCVYCANAYRQRGYSVRRV